MSYVALGTTMGPCQDDSGCGPEERCCGGMCRVLSETNRYCEDFDCAEGEVWNYQTGECENPCRAGEYYDYDWNLCLPVDDDEPAPAPGRPSAAAAKTAVLSTAGDGLPIGVLALGGVAVITIAYYMGAR